MNLERELKRMLERRGVVRVSRYVIRKCLPPIMDKDLMPLNADLILSGHVPVFSHTSEQRLEVLCKQNNWKFQEDYATGDYLVRKKNPLTNPETVLKHS